MPNAKANACDCLRSKPSRLPGLHSKLTLPGVRWWGGDAPQLGCGSGNLTPGNVIRPLAQVRGRGESRDGAGSANPRDRHLALRRTVYCVFSRTTVANAITERHAASSRLGFGPSRSLSSRDGTCAGTAGSRRQCERTKRAKVVVPFRSPAERGWPSQWSLPLSASRGRDVT